MTKDLGVAAGAAPLTAGQASPTATDLGLPWYAIRNSWQITTLVDSFEMPVFAFDLEDWAVTEENQDVLEKRQAEFVAFTLKAVNGHYPMRARLQATLDTLALMADAFPLGSATRNTLEDECRDIRAALTATEA